MDNQATATLRFRLAALASALTAGLLAISIVLMRPAAPRPTAPMPAAAAPPAGPALAATAPPQAAPAAITPAPAPVVGAGTIARASPGDVYSIQLGMFRDTGNTAALARIATAAGYAPSIVNRPGSDGVVWHALLLGRYPDPATASRAAASLRRDIGARGIVVKLPQAAGVTKLAGATP